jgi:Bacterial cadherin-like domain
VDNVRLNRLFGSDYITTDDDPREGWRVVVQQPTLHDDALSTNEDSLVSTTAQSLLGNDTNVVNAFGALRFTGVSREGTSATLISPATASSHTIREAASTGSPKANLPPIRSVTRSIPAMARKRSEPFG